MLREQTLEKLRHMQLRGMAAALVAQSQDPEAQALSFEERLGLLVDEEWTQRRNRALERLLREAKLRLAACPEDLDYSPARGLDRALMRSLSPAPSSASTRTFSSWAPRGGQDLRGLRARERLLPAEPPSPLLPALGAPHGADPGQRRRELPGLHGPSRQDRAPHPR